MSPASVSPPIRGHLLVLLSATLWGTTGTAQALGPDASSPLTVGALRLLVAGVVLGAVAAATRRASSGTLRRPATAAAAAAMAAYQPLFFTAVDRTGVAIGTLVAIGSAPLFAGALQRTVEGHRPTTRWLWTSGLAIAGLALLMGSGDQIDPMGVALALGAGFSYAVFATAVGRLTSVAATTSMAVVFGLAAVLLLPSMAGRSLVWVAEPAGVATVLWLGIMATAAAYLLFATGLRTTPVSSAATLSLAEPVTAVALGLLVLGERPGPVALAGAALIAVALVALISERDPTAKPAALGVSPAEPRRRGG